MHCPLNNTEHPKISEKCLIPQDAPPDFASPPVPEPVRKRPTFRQVATAVCGNVKFRKQRKAGPLDVAQMELSFHRTVSKSSVCTLAARLRMPGFSLERQRGRADDILQSYSLTRSEQLSCDSRKFVNMVMRSPSVWDLEAPRLLLSIVGGAGEMNLDPAVEAHFCEELVGAAKQTHGWVITGGTDSGVMDLVGRAMHRLLRIKRRAVSFQPKATMRAARCPALV
eukprot:g19142.t1